jgi:hypothetical protein
MKRPGTTQFGSVPGQAIHGPGEARLGGQGGNRAGAQQRGATAGAPQSAILNPHSNQSAPFAPGGVATRPDRRLDDEPETQVG